MSRPDNPTSGKYFLRSGKSSTTPVRSTFIQPHFPTLLSIHLDQSSALLHQNVNCPSFHVLNNRPRLHHHPHLHPPATTTRTVLPPPTTTKWLARLTR